MGTAEKAVIIYEAGQSLVPMGALSDAGDHKRFDSEDDLWSARDGFEPVVRPDGVITGGTVTPGGAPDSVSVAKLDFNLSGAHEVIEGGTVAFTRDPVEGFLIVSIQIDDQGALGAVEGTAHSTAHNETRGSAGGPPWIPVGAIEIAQIRLTSNVSGPVLPSEIKQVPGHSQERADFPVYDIHHFSVNKGAAESAGIMFASPLPLSHEGGKTKGVFVEYYEPEFQEIDKSENFVAPETSHSVSSRQIYNKTTGTKTSTLGQGGFTIFLKDGVSDSFLTLKNETLFFKFKPHRLREPYLLTLGTLGIARTFPAGDEISAACTISAKVPGVEVTG